MIVWVPFLRIGTSLVHKYRKALDGAAIHFLDHLHPLNTFRQKNALRFTLAFKGYDDEREMAFEAKSPAHLVPAADRLLLFMITPCHWHRRRS